jgi:hypothetical protein
MLLVHAADGKIHVRPSANRCGIFRHPATISCETVQWRGTADEDGHYCFAVAL